jgi:hypothetical protein
MNIFYNIIIKILFGTLCLIMASCSSSDPAGPDMPQVAEISIFPKEVELEVGEQVDFSVVALTVAGDTVDTDEIDIQWEWWSTNTDVFTVEPGGLATAHDTGVAFCVVEATVDISLNTAEEMDIRYAGIGFQWNLNHETKTNNPEQLPEINFMEMEKAAVKNNMLRFGGRDTGIVVVF